LHILFQSVQQAQHQQQDHLDQELIEVTPEAIQHSQRIQEFSPRMVVAVVVQRQLLQMEAEDLVDLVVVDLILQARQEQVLVTE
jgi:hypothetical protein